MGRTFAVIGAGIAGASIAYHLGKQAHDDDRVVVFEQGGPSEATTARSVAQFGYYGDQLQYEMKRYGKALYNEFFADPRRDLGYQFAGLLSVARTHAERDRLTGVAANDGDPSAGKTAGTGWDRDCVMLLDPEELQQEVLVPPLDVSAVTGAIYRPRMGYLTRPATLGREFVDRAQEHGVDFRFETPVTDIRTDDGTVTRVVADETLPVDAVACAAGPWNPDVAAMVGLDLPVRHTLAPVMHLEPTEPIGYDMPAITEFDGPHSIHRRGPQECLISYNPPGGYELDQRHDPAAVDDTVPGDIREGMWNAVRTLTPALADAPLVDEWVGVRSQTPDGNPIVGWTAVEGFSIAAFHTSGIQLSPAVGKVISRQLLAGERTNWYDGLSIARFEGYEDHRR